MASPCVCCWPDRLLAGLRLLLVLLPSRLLLPCAAAPAALSLLLAGLGLLLLILLTTTLRLQAAALLERGHQLLELGDHPHAARGVTGVGQGARALDDLLNVALTLAGELGLADPLLDPVELRHAFLALLLRHGRHRRHQCEAGPGQQCSS